MLSVITLFCSLTKAVSILFQAMNMSEADADKDCAVVQADCGRHLSSRLSIHRFCPCRNLARVNVGFLYSATYTANQNSALHNLGSGNWLAIVSGAAALCGLSTARANGHWTRGCSQRTHHRPNQPHQAFTLTLVSFRQVSPLQPK